MKSLTEYINEGLFSRIKKTNALNKFNKTIPDKMPKKYIECIEEYFSDIMQDINTQQDVEDHLKYACDEFWDLVHVEFWDSEKIDFVDYREAIYNKWIDQIVKIVFKIR